MQHLNIRHVYAVWKIGSHCQAKRLFEKIVSSAIPQSDDSIFCLITTFISPDAASLLRLRGNVFMKNLLEIICIFWFPWLASCQWIGEWQKRRSLLNVNVFCHFLFDKFPSCHRGTSLLQFYAAPTVCSFLVDVAWKNLVNKVLNI